MQTKGNSWPWTVVVPVVGIASMVGAAICLSGETPDGGNAPDRSSTSAARSSTMKSPAAVFSQRKIKKPTTGTIVRLRRTHWFTQAYRTEDLDKIAALVGVSRRSWEPLEVFRRRVRHERTGRGARLTERFLPTTNSIRWSPGRNRTMAGLDAAMPPQRLVATAASSNRSVGQSTRMEIGRSTPVAACTSASILAARNELPPTRYPLRTKKTITAT